MAGNKNLSAAKVNKNDEFYTQRVDIENELKHYKPHFAGKVVYCNCDDPYESWFFKYFAMNFNALGLKKLIATSYDGSSVAGTEINFDGTEGESKARKIIIDQPIEDYNGDGAVDDQDIRIYLQKFPPEILISNDDYKPGDFRSKQCIELLKEADIVVTNPPFSLFREYIAQLFEYGKQFLVLGRMSALHYIEVFPKIMEGTMWCGVGFNLSMVYQTSYENTLDANKKYVKSKGFDPEKNYIKVPAICWFTNLDHKKRHEELDLYKKYNSTDYPKYDNFDAINVDKVSEIPYDYAGLMGVPDTILGQYNPDQFEILGACIPEYVDKLGISRIGETWMSKYRAIGGTGHYTANMKSLVLYDNNGTPRAIYSRIIIRNKHPQKPII